MPFGSSSRSSGSMTPGKLENTPTFCSQFPAFPNNDECSKSLPLRSHNNDNNACILAEERDPSNRLPADGTRGRWGRGVVFVTGVAGLVIGGSVGVKTLSDVCEKRETTARLRVCKIGGSRLREWCEGCGVCLRHCESVWFGLVRCGS